jgi:hypothetical protein
MDILDRLLEKGYLFQADEPGFFFRCADATLEYQSWEGKISPTQRKTQAPFGLILARECNQAGAQILYRRLRKNWNELNYNPDTLALCTSKCNLNCSYCIIGAPNASEFKLPNFGQIEKALSLFPVKRVEITGGEPLAEKSNFSEILEGLIGKVSRCEVLTNGFGWDGNLWPLLLRCGRELDLRMRLTLSENLSHMKLSEFETKILPMARQTPEVKINLNFLPNHDGSGLLRFLKRLNQLELPTHITVTPICLLESEFSGAVEFDMEQYLKEIMEAVENETEYLGKVNFNSGNNLRPLIDNFQLLGCRQGSIALTDRGYGLCHMLLREGQFYKGPLDIALANWGNLMAPCRNCRYYPDDCIEAIKAGQCSLVTTGCNCCPLLYICTLRCPHIFQTKAGHREGSIDLQCLGYSLLRILGYWLTYGKQSIDKLHGEITLDKQDF